MKDITYKGRVTSKPVLRETESGLAMCRFSAKMIEGLNDLAEFDIVTWSKTAVACSEMEVGQFVTVTGRVDDTVEVKGRGLVTRIVATTVRFG